MVQQGNYSRDVAIPDDGFAIGDILRGERATLGKSLLDVQRDLRIKAAHIAAIEDLDPAAFPNPAFIPGFVRSYARYLNLDPDEVYARFCRDADFTPKAKTTGPALPSRRAAGGRGEFALPGSVGAAGVAARLGDIPFAAIGSLMVMTGLVAGLGYGGWAVLQNIQRVQFAPVEELPLAQSEVAALEAPLAETLAEPVLSDLASPVAATALADLYRRQEIEVPILMPRDGPIAAIDPERNGPLAGRAGILAEAIGPQPAPVAGPVLAAAPAGPTVPVEAAQMVVSETSGPVTIVAERAAWVRVYLADRTVLFERILETGETYSPPADVEAPMIWAGNSGSVYVWVGDRLHGPLGSGTRAVRDVVLEPEAIATGFAVIDAIPAAIVPSTPRPAERSALVID
jgi:cytoskeletal protein RodZ